jgi:dsDNA-specific endonuclease/ATPase MutS2
MIVRVFVGLYVLATESARIPWFDNIYADIGDEQSLLQSLSTFSGHLKQISVSLFSVVVTPFIS